MIRLLSVPHTGTRFVRQMLDAHDVPYERAHFWGQFVEPLIYLRDTPAVIPRRRKDNVAKSWERRLKHEAPKPLDAAWREMERYASANPELVYFLDIDNERTRLSQLQEINVLVGVDLDVDFNEKVGEGR